MNLYFDICINSRITFDHEKQRHSPIRLIAAYRSSIKIVCKLILSYLKYKFKQIEFTSQTCSLSILCISALLNGRKSIFIESKTVKNQPTYCIFLIFDSQHAITGEINESWSFIILQLRRRS